MTPEPTLAEEASEDYVLELLETNGGCLLPCFWGIIPGQTGLEEAIRFFDHLGWLGGDYYYGTVYATGKDLKKPLNVGVMLYKRDGIIVETVHASVAGNDYMGLVKAYSFKQILTTYGLPTQVWINLATGLEINTPTVTEFRVLLYYQDEAVLIKYGGSAVKIGQAYRLCPTSPNYGNPDELPTQGAVSITLGIPGKGSTPEDLIEPFGLFDGMFTVDKALGLSVEEFYNQAMENRTPVCFETPRDVWP